MRHSILRLLRPALLVWSAVLFLPAWLVTVRGFCDGPSYSWRVSARIRGQGTSGYYFIAPLTATYGLTLLALGWRGVMRPFHLLLVAWHLPLGVIASFAAFRHQDALRLQGDTLGVDISLAHVAPAVFASAAAGALALACCEPPATTGRPPQAPSRRLLGLALAILPAQFLLLRTGPQHGLTDKLGVILTISQWALINVGLARRS